MYCFEYQLDYKIIVSKSEMTKNNIPAQLANKQKKKKVYIFSFSFFSSGHSRVSTPVKKKP